MLSETLDARSDVIIFGVGQLADVARVYLEQTGHNIVAFTVDEEYLRSETHNGLPVLTWRTLETSISPNSAKLFCPISYRKLNALRISKFLEGKQKGFEFISFIHKNCINNASSIGENCFILENNVLQPFSRIGDNVVLWSGNHIGHHSIVENHCFMSSHVVVSGGVTIGQRSFLGVNSTIADNLTLGEAVVVGAGALVLRSLPNESVVAPRGSEISSVPSSRLRGL